MKLIVGLGNPGRKYTKNRHNLGFIAVDQLSQTYQIPLDQKKFKAIFGKGSIEGCPVILAQPQTYMNLSGEAVVSLANYFKIEIEDIIVIVDDLNLDFGRIRIRKKGSDGGHNGLKSINEHLGNTNYPRIRLGIGLPQYEGDVSNFVLSNFTEEEQKEMDNFIGTVKESIITAITVSIDKAMNQFNS